MSYWVYVNWTAEHKAVIHWGSCGNCNNGKGCHPNPLGEKNGAWRGPFRDLDEARERAKETHKPVREHACVTKGP